MERMPRRTRVLVHSTASPPQYHSHAALLKKEKDEMSVKRLDRREVQRELMDGVIARSGTEGTEDESG